MVINQKKKKGFHPFIVSSFMRLLMLFGLLLRFAFARQRELCRLGEKVVKVIIIVPLSTTSLVRLKGSDNERLTNSIA